MKLGDLRKALRRIAPERADALPEARTLALLDGDEAPARCPKCHAVAPCVHYDSVDVGVGTMTGNHQYECPVHGVFAFGHDDGKPLFQDDDPPEKPPADIEFTATVTTEGEARRSAWAIMRDLANKVRDGEPSAVVPAAMSIPEVAWASLHAPDGSEIAPRTPITFKSGAMDLPPLHFDSRCIPDPTTGTLLLPGETIISELRSLVPFDELDRRIPDIKALPKEVLGVGSVLIVSPGGAVARIDIPDSAGSDVSFAPVCGICGDVNCETPNAKH